MFKLIFNSSPYLYSLKKRGILKKNFLRIQDKLICNQHTPLHIYNATKYSKKSMNHRLFYINWLFVFLFLDTCNNHLDI
ncbi:conserved Plasmodium protein, unknown function [Plasmodium gallinaceum]|uniref:Uncharacterized protein n=1 Tax=Plasmodium gallinaceum TaxID=5849 RepID=A0A1J1GVB5_PLAGA|nr:conserved Plasmodium protein, unknown function [Plasmodium gallinaceum]CRG94979.1 conserved Plasmodium protein, unknown function [Plasmodium gallinaceum]